MKTTSVENPIAVYVPFSAVFPGIPDNFETFKSLLCDLSRTDSLFWCARLNKIISSPSDATYKERQQFGLNQFMTEEEIDRVNAFTREEGGAERVTIFFRGQLLELIRWVLLYSHDHRNDGVTFEDPDVRRKFAQAALLARDIWARRVFGRRFRDTGDILQDRRSALGAIRKAMEDTSLGESLPQSVGRGWTLFNDIFPRYYPDFHKEFTLATGLTLEEFYNCLCAITTSFINDSGNSGLFNSNGLGQNTLYKQVLEKYIALESQTVDELKNALWNTREVVEESEAGPFDYLPLRQRPILRAKDGRSIILDPRFYSDRASIGPLFCLLSNQKSDKKKANLIFSVFGETVEEYSCGILERMYPAETTNLHQRLICDLRGTDKKGNDVQIADACLNDVTEIVLFEIKSVWLKDEEILTDDPDDFIKHLIDKYVFSGGNGKKGGKRGIKQLADAISKLSSNDWVARELDFSKVNRIYPVLVVRDSLLDSPVYTYFLASEFKNLLSPDDELRSGEMIKGKFRITPLIIMTLEELENFEASVEHFGLRELLEDYTTACPDRLVSLQNFIAFSKYKDLFRHNRTLAEKTLDILSKTKEKVFNVPPGHIGDSSGRRV